MKTLKFLVLLVMALVCSQISKAQTDLTFGIRAGANYGNLYGNPATLDRKGKVGIVAGVFARVGDRLYVEPGLNFSSFGSKFDFNAQKYDVKFNRMQVPLLVGYKFITDKNFNLHAGAGPEFSYNINKPIKVQTFEYKKFNTAGKLEAGVDIKNLNIDLAYSYGLNKINKNLDQKPGIYSLTLGFHFL